MKPFVKTICLIFIATLGIFAAQAQLKPVKNAVTPVKKFKPPVLKTFLGNYSDSVTITENEARQLIGGALKITDVKKNAYTLTYYEFMYKRKVVAEDEGTGKLTPASTVVADHFKTSPLPELWVNTIRDQVKAGEELYFFDIIVKDAQGRVMFAPNLKLMVK